MGLARGEWRTGTKSLKEKSEGEMIEYSNSQISELIDDYIHNARGARAIWLFYFFYFFEKTY